MNQRGDKKPKQQLVGRKSHKKEATKEKKTSLKPSQNVQQQ